MKHVDTVFLWLQAMVTESKISLSKKPTKEMLADFLTKHVDAKLHGRIWNEIPVKREQANLESVILSADRDDCCAETGYVGLIVLVAPFGPISKVKVVFGF